MQCNASSLFQVVMTSQLVVKQPCLYRVGSHCNYGLVGQPPWFIASFYKCFWNWRRFHPGHFFFRRSLLKRTILRPQLQILLSWLSSLPDLYQREHLGTKLEDLVIYTTTQTHTLGSKAGRMLGLQVRTINVAPDDQFALRGRALRDALEKDAKIG